MDQAGTKSGHYEAKRGSLDAVECWFDCYDSESRHRNAAVLECVRPKQALARKELYLSERQI